MCATLKHISADFCFCFDIQRGLRSILSSLVNCFLFPFLGGVVAILFYCLVSYVFGLRLSEARLRIRLSLIFI